MREVTEQPVQARRVKRWGNRRKPAKRQGQGESPDFDPHPILDPRPLFGLHVLHVAGSRGLNRGEAGPQTVHSVMAWTGEFWRVLAVRSIQ